MTDKSSIKSSPIASFKVPMVIKKIVLSKSEEFLFVVSNYSNEPNENNDSLKEFNDGDNIEKETTV